MTYASLVAEHPLRVIKDDKQYAKARSFWTRYMEEAKYNPRTSASVIEYAEVLSLLMAKYEKEKLDEEFPEDDA